MRSRNSAAGLLLALASLCHAGTFRAPADSPWPSILSSAGHAPTQAGAAADIYVAPLNAPASPDWRAKAITGAAVILEGGSPLAAEFGFKPGSSIVSCIHIVDEHNPNLPVIWASAIAIPRNQAPPGARIFAKERWTGAPVIAGYRLGAGAVLWLAASPGANGYERFPYIAQALADLGFGPSFRSARLWAFFDDSYRSRADPDYLAGRWRKAGIAALHVASWHFFDADSAHDRYLENLIAACHRHGILVYAWIELPHVSDAFWNLHPEWREKTALLQDAQLDWRKLMNLQNPDCVRAIQAGLRAMMRRFDWDGVNLAELYFESLEGAANPARFTPMNDDVRAMFRARFGWDPIEIWRQRKDPASLRQFLDFRAAMAGRMQADWLHFAADLQTLHPGLDLVLTHVDDRFDTGMKDAIGADAARVLPLLDTQPFSFLIEDPATVWNLGPRRYPEIAKRYAPLTSHRDRLAIDINIVDRYQDVYPTRQQTGTELFELVHMASTAFPRVALYFENSILKPDLPFLSAAAANVTDYSKGKQRISIASPEDLDLVWSGGATVDGKPWPLIAAGAIHLAAGEHLIQPAPPRTGISIADLNATLLSASADARHAVFRYTSNSRAIVRFDRKPAAMTLDGKTFAAECLEETNCTLMLPSGDHTVTAR
ncbi:MAG TPA: hypothetical protein VFT60_09535 [Bryobacteraceae bacterium]|nr:hypothetical protein [Bryobacteraceae bacterium]